MICVRSYVRPDELQSVFIVSTEDGFAIVEAVELWEAPAFEPEEGDCFTFYPTIIRRARYQTIDAAAEVVKARFDWT